MVPGGGMDFQSAALPLSYPGIGFRRLKYLKINVMGGRVIGLS